MNLFDTHCHLNFSRFKSTSEEVIQQAQQAGVTQIVIPSTDLATSVRALEIAKSHENIYCAVGIHPHHIFEYLAQDEASAASRLEHDLKAIELMLGDPKVVAVGEVGLDRHYYTNTKYEQYQISDSFIALQKQMLEKQIQLAVQYKKSLILHNRETSDEMLDVLSSTWDDSLKGRSVFHCCEPQPELLEFARAHHMYLGIDGDITYTSAKQEFIQSVPLDMLVLETDAPYLLPEPYRTRREFPNTPARLKDICHFVADVRGEAADVLAARTTQNACSLFAIAPLNPSENHHMSIESTIAKISPVS